jgi:ATP-dependent Clp protease ATP-binding subunit ClpA
LTPRWSLTQPFLNLFDEGWVSDQRGVKGYANKSIFILTSNVGQRIISEMFREGKEMSEIAARMKEALSQIRHSKSDRPVFTPELLARIKRIIVFNPLDRAAMAGISRRQFAELQRAWVEKRNKRLNVPAELVELVGERAHHLNEKSGGKEGGRIVRKLLSEWVETRLQREVSGRPHEYRRSTAISIGMTPRAEAAEQTEGPPLIAVEFS